MTSPIRVDLVDISHHQAGPIDYAAARRAGVRGMYHKATEGETFVDPNYARRRREADAAGMPFGAYCFARPDLGDAEAEARRFVTAATPKPGDLIPALDLETTEGLTLDQLRPWAHRFSRVVRDLTGVEAGVKPRDVGRVDYSPFDLDTTGIRWRPRYNPDNRPPSLPWDLWQFSNGDLGVPNSVAGFGHVDLNTFADGVRLADLRIPDPVDDDDEATGSLRFVTQNVQSLPLMSQPDVVADVTLTATQGGIVGWQEIGPNRYEDAIRALDPDRWAHHGIENGDPVSYRRRVWTQRDAGAELLHEPMDRDGVRLGRRSIVWVVLEHRRTGVEVLVHNAHYIARAWGHRTGDEAAQQPLRQAVWHKGNARHVRFLLGQIEAHPGRPIVGLGDYNRQRRLDPPTLGESLRGRRVRDLVGPSSIDHVTVIDGDAARWEVDDADGELLLGRNSDHQGRRGRARLVVR